MADLSVKKEGNKKSATYKRLEKIYKYMDKLNEEYKEAYHASEKARDEYKVPLFGKPRGEAACRKAGDKLRKIGERIDKINAVAQRFEDQYVKEAMGTSQEELLTEHFGRPKEGKRGRGGRRASRC